MLEWTPFPHAGTYTFTDQSLKKNWARLHRGDCEPLPHSAGVLQAWVQFHNGNFQQAVEVGLRAGGAGITAANKAACIYATYLETREKTRLDLLMQAAARAEMQQATEPHNANAWYWQAYALGRYSQGISVAKVLAHGLGNKVKTALEHAIGLMPEHAEAHIGLATFHAEVIDKVGTLIGGMTYGAKKDTGLALYKEALRLNPGSVIAMTEYANGMVMLEGDDGMEQATRLYEQAAACQPMDAMEQLEVDMARVELQD